MMRRINVQTDTTKDLKRLEKSIWILTWFQAMLMMMNFRTLTSSKPFEGIVFGGDY